MHELDIDWFELAVKVLEKNMLTSLPKSLRNSKNNNDFYIIVDLLINNFIKR
jgi:hypothetical protein